MSSEETTNEMIEESTSPMADDALEPSADQVADVTASAVAAPAAPSVPYTYMPTATVETLPQWKPIPARQRRLLGVMMEKAKTTPDAYPLSLAGLVTGANQKSNRYPLMNLTPEQVEDELTVLRRLGAAAEIQGSGRVPKYRHYGHTWLGVKGAEAAVMIELLLRGHQTAGDLRGRASRFEPIADLPALQTILSSLMERKLVIALTPPGRGQLFTHSLYMPEELEALRGKITLPADEEDEQSGASGSKTPRVSLAAELSAARDEIVELKAEIARLQAKLEHLDG